jgi:hypothetical protein
MAGVVGKQLPEGEGWLYDVKSRQSQRMNPAPSCNCEITETSPGCAAISPLPRSDAFRCIAGQPFWRCPSTRYARSGARPASPWAETLAAGNEHLYPGGHAIQQSATTLLPDAAELSRTSRTTPGKTSQKIAYLRPALSFEFVRKLALKQLVAESSGSHSCLS